MGLESTKVLEGCPRIGDPDFVFVFLNVDCQPSQDSLIMQQPVVLDLKFFVVLM